MRFLYPNGLKKALTFSYDDGRVYDRRLVEILNHYNMKGTFHLNSGKLDLEGYVTRREIGELYRGHEISCHGVEHLNPNGISPQRLNGEIGDDRRALEELAGYLIQGMSYAYGQYSQSVQAVARINGIHYARTTSPTHRFFPPEDFLQWHPTCHHSDNLEALGDQFLDIPGYYELPLMYIWGHSYEFGIPDDWHLIIDFCEKTCKKPDIWYATNQQIYSYVTAVRNLNFSGDAKSIHNPTAETIWLEAGGKGLTIAPGEILRPE